MKQSDTKVAAVFGAYPQSQVKDPALINALNNRVSLPSSSSNSSQWKSLEFYFDFNKCDAWYIDISLGEDKYRGVYFSEYRSQSTESEHTCIDRDKYSLNTVYWFKFEPIAWEITPDNILVSEKILDSREYFYNASSGAWPRTSYDGKNAQVFSNNYCYSTVRGWLNTEFYEAAFSEKEKEAIALTTVDNSYASTVYSSDPDFVPEPPVFGSFARPGYVGLVSTFDVYCGNSADKIFLLSYKEYKRYVCDEEKNKEATDYAYCINEFCDWGWWLRSPMNNVTYQVYVAEQHHLFSWKTAQLYGIVPALKLNSSESHAL